MGGVVKDINDNNEHGTFIQITKGLFEEGGEWISGLFNNLFFNIIWNLFFYIVDS